MKTMNGVLFTAFDHSARGIRNSVKKTAIQNLSTTKLITGNL